MPVAFFDDCCCATHFAVVRLETPVAAVRVHCNTAAVHMPDKYTHV